MTLVNHETGEVIDTMAEADARRLTERIRLLAENVAEQIDKLATLIDQARLGSAWLALGYRSWTAYVAAEFSNVLPRLDREPRQEFVRELAARGMSSRAIAPVVRSSDRQVRRDMSGGTDVPPAPKVAAGAPAGADGRVESRFESETVPAAEPQGAREDVPVAPASERRPAVTGMDGKRYSAPPARPAANEGDLADFLDSDITLQDSKYLKELLTAMNRLRLSEFDAERTARIADDLTVVAIDHFAESVAAWHHRFTHQRTGLRVIDGGAQ